MSDAYRSEHDFAGTVNVPVDGLWGAQTQRAREAFNISRLRLPGKYIHVLGSLKRAAVRANRDLGIIVGELAAVIESAAGEVADGLHDDQFDIDLFQTGSGTNMNMAANEVIANRANQLLGTALGSRHPIHPNDHVNRGQSSNDVTPTVIHVAALLGIREKLQPEVERLRDSLRNVAARTRSVVKTGRTHLQDAVPITLGQEFEGHTGQLERDLGHLETATLALTEVALGGTAIGTGINGHPEFASTTLSYLSDDLQLELRETTNHFRAQNNVDDVLFVSGTLRTVAASLRKIADDIRWMSSGPYSGLAELHMDSLGMGSSIMPGKSNPVIAEAVVQVVAKVIGNDATIQAASGHGNFEIIVTSPVVAYTLLESIDILGGACSTLADRCVDTLEATKWGPELVKKAPMLATALTPLIGYDRAAEMMRLAAETGKSVYDIAAQSLDLTEQELRDLLDPFAMSMPPERGPATLRSGCGRTHTP